MTAAQMRAIEARAMAGGTVTGAELMERAGAGLVAAVLAEWPELAALPRRAVILCGPGNNGGDGFVVARLLAGRGWDVAAFLYGDPARLPADARANHDRWCAMGPVTRLGFPQMTRDDAEGVAAAAADAGRPCDLVVDALFGTGLGRAPDGLAPLFAAAEGWDGPGTRRVAVDVPTGLCADSGRTFAAGPEGARPVLAADLTVTFGFAKPGHLLSEGPAACGRLALCDIGLTEEAGEASVAPVRRPAPALLQKRPDAHKYDYGHALILTGPMGRTGAARLAARAALRVGAGLVTLGAPGEAMAECAAQSTAVMLRQVERAEDLSAMLDDARISAVGLGPGLGTGERARALVAAALRATALGDAPGRGVALDADALTVLAGTPEDLFPLLHAGCVLTPHMGEFARLFPDLAERLTTPPERGPAFSKVDAARAAAARAGATLLLKGMDTVIASPGGAAAIHLAAGDRAAPWLATAGTGDVLTGLVTGLLARGVAGPEAAAAAVWLHAETARRAGPGLIAEDLPEALPAVLRAALASDAAAPA